MYDLIELTTTRHNPHIDPFMSMWEWQIPLYLFLGGIVAGMMIISGYFLFSQRYKYTDCACFSTPLISLIAISIGMFFLFLDLAHKPYVWRLYTTFKINSPMSWGAWILLLVYPALILNLLLRPPVFLQNFIKGLGELSNRLSQHTFLIKVIAISNMLIGLMLGAYTGVLLSVMVSRPLWNSALLWFFIFSFRFINCCSFCSLVC